MRIRYKILIVVVVILSSFAAGRYSTPEKIKIETKVVEVEKKVVDNKKDKHKETKIVYVTRPDGSKEKTETIVEDTKSSTESQLNLVKHEDTKKEETRGDSKVTLSGLAGIDARDGKPIFGGAVSKPVLGPITLGAFGLSNGSIGASLGLTF